MSSSEASKNEQKKLAKKAAKQARPDGPTPAAATTTTTETTNVTHQPTPPPLLIANPTSNNAATFKTVWASLAFDVPLRTVNSAQLPPGTDLFLSQRHPVLLYGDQIVSGSGNAMAQTIAYMSHTEIPHQDTIIIDQWDEWEKTQLRHQNKPEALLHLQHTLQHTSTGIHLLGTHDTVADICILTTLKDMDLTEYPTLQHYLQAHANIMEQVQAQIEQLIVVSPYEMDWTETSLNKVLYDAFKTNIENLFGKQLDLPPSIVQRCNKPKDGDFQCNAAMKVFAELKQNDKIPTGIQSPQQLAQLIADSFGQDHPVVMDATVNGPGFVACRVQPAFLEYHVNQFLATGKLMPPGRITQETCLVDFSSPNVAKEMHVGHLRSTIIGEAVCRILEFVGHKVHRVNHIGDWGTQFGMLIQYLKEEYPDLAQNAELPNITDLTQFYKNAKNRFDNNPEFKKLSQTNVVKLQAGDTECRRIWKMLCDVSRQEFEKVYVRLDVVNEEYGESFYNDKIPAVVEEFEKAGKLSIEEGGAKCVFVKGFNVPLMLQKSDGGYGYDSTDMAALKYRLKELKADRIIVITDFSQGDHFKMVYAAGRDIGWVENQRLEHIGFGTVMGEDGKRFKTRSGDTVRLVDLLDEAVSRMEASLRARIDEKKANITVDEVHEVAEAIGYGAVKYYDLRRNPTTNYKFSYDQMLDTKGDTAVYLLYARVRLESICAKAKEEHGVDVEELLKSGEKIVVSHPSERNLALHLQFFTDTIDQTLEDLFPYHICEYVYKLSIAASDFVTQCKVLGSTEMKSRLLLCHATTVAMHQCFDLLGIRHVKRI